MIKGEVETEKFIEYVHTVKSRFPRMVKTMKKIALMIELNTVPYVPLDTSDLEQSYEFIVQPLGDMITLRLGYDAEDEDTGFHYAYYQHENVLDHPRRGIDHYLTVGVMDSRFEAYEMIETDYLSLFFGGTITDGVFNGLMSSSVLHFGSDI